ncbi:actin-interacting protein 1-like [Amphiura filiformis]|uniref:actin-interacting protein 1-like n=1 Tax=Amphiura filiformis TaxID=82378 RepID=UPI003B21BF16
MSYTCKSTLASLPATTRGYPIVLGGDPKGKNFLYCNGNYIYIRDIEDPSKCDVYAEHQYQTSVAKYAPSGFYIASGDQTGKIRIWDTTNAEHILKAEYQPIGGVIKDLAWSPDSKRIVVGGEGREKFGHVFLFDSGSSVGEVSSHSKPINSVDYKPSRPFRIITGSEDFHVAFFEGPPFKFKLSHKDHSRFLQAVRYSPDGEFFATGGADGKVIVYNGKDATKVCELGEGGQAHKGGIYAVSWSPDSTQLLSASGDKSAKIWDVKENVCKTEFQMGSEVMDQQIGCLWQGEHIITVSLSGAINYLDKNNPDTPLQIVKGHNKLISAMTTSEDGSTIYTASTDGRVVVWDAASGKNDTITGRLHANQVNGMTLVGDKVASIGMDDKLKFFSTADKAYTDSELSTGSQPKSICSSHGGLIVVGCVDQVQVYRTDVKSSSISVPYVAQSVAIHPNHQEIAVGANDTRIYIYSLDSSDVLTEKTQLKVGGAVNTLAYSPDGKFLCSSGQDKEVSLFDLGNNYEKSKHHWQHHTASVNEISWSPDSQHIVSCSLDTGLIVWSVEKPGSYIKMLRSHPRANIRNVRWLSNTSVVSAADDCCVKIWDITHH